MFGHFKSDLTQDTTPTIPELVWCVETYAVYPKVTVSVSIFLARSIFESTSAYLQMVLVTVD